MCHHIPTFLVGYLKGWGNQKCWIVQQEDLKVMHESFNPEDGIKLWCESTVKEEGRGKRGNENMSPNPRGKRMKISSQRFVHSLKKSMEKSIVVQLTHYGQSLLEMDATRAMMNLHRYRSSLVNREEVFNPKSHFLILWKELQLSSPVLWAHHHHLLHLHQAMLQLPFQPQLS